MRTFYFFISFRHGNLFQTNRRFQSQQKLLISSCSTFFCFCCLLPLLLLLLFNNVNIISRVIMTPDNVVLRCHILLISIWRPLYLLSFSNFYKDVLLFLLLLTVVIVVVVVILLKKQRMLWYCKNNNPYFIFYLYIRSGC